jgi:hypothetical protein
MRRALFELAMKRAGSSLGAIVGYVIAGITVLVGLVLAAGARRSTAIEHVPMAAAWLLVWGAGILVAVGAAARGLRRDREEGIVELLESRGHGRGAYVRARVGALALLLFLVTGGGTLVVGVVSTLLAMGGHRALGTLQSTLAGLAYDASFSAMVGPIALATLGARSRAGGYVGLLLVLFVPTLASGLTSQLVPEGWESLVSIPGALDSIRSAIAPPGFDPLGLVRAIVFSGIVTLLALLFVRVEAASIESEP